MPTTIKDTLTIYEAIDMEPFKSKLLEKGNIVEIKKNANVSINGGELFFITDGAVLMKKSQPDNPDEEVYLGIVDGFTPLGLMEVYYPHIKFEYLTQTSAKFIRINVDDFKVLMKEDMDANEVLMRILLQMNVMQIHMLYERSAGSGFTTISMMLSRYIAREELGHNLNEGIASFILKRTRLSKSYVFHILAELKKGGYITITNGKLVSINRKIPDKY